MKNSILKKINEYWNAANYLAVGQIYLLDNPLLKKQLEITDIKPRLLGHFGTVPGLNFIYAHLNQQINEKDLNMIYICGPGHGGPGIIANAYLEGTYSEVFPEISEDEIGLKKLFKQFSFPGGIPSHVAPQTPGSIHEGGELGYSLSHAYGAAFDNPDLIVACIIGDGEAETGPLATSWHSNKFINPIRDGAVLPILHLNGYKIAGPTILDRIDHDELINLFIGYGYSPYYIEGEDPNELHEKMYSTLDIILTEIKTIQTNARQTEFKVRPKWPMLILKTPKGWTCPKIVDEKQIEGTFRSHQVPITDFINNKDHIKILEDWMKSYKPENLFDSNGKLNKSIKELAPKGNRRMSNNPHTNSNFIPLKIPEITKYAININSPGTVFEEATKIQGKLIRDIIKLNENNFRVFSPDETSSNRLGAVFEVTQRMSSATILSSDENISNDGRVLEMLSEHQCQGWLEGYLLTGRHGVFSCYEAFIHIIDSMFNQHAKWLNTCRTIPWRNSIPSLNYLLTSHVWRQDHNGLSHQDPGFIDLVVNKKAAVIRTYFPPDANCLLCVTEHCLKSKDYINVILCGKQPSLQWLAIDEAIKHCTSGISIWNWASNDNNSDPDVVMACAGDVPTLETLAAVSILKKELPELKIRVVNIVDLMKLQPETEHPHGLSDDDFDSYFTKNKPVIFSYHGYPYLIHRLTYRRNNHKNIHVRGYKEEGTTTTPFDMVVLNEMDRFHLVIDVINRVPGLKAKADYLKQKMKENLILHYNYIRIHGQDLEEILNWKWIA